VRGTRGDRKPGGKGTNDERRRVKSPCAGTFWKKYRKSNVFQSMEGFTFV